MQYRVIVSSKIIYKQQFVAAVQKKNKYTTKANSNKS